MHVLGGVFIIIGVGRLQHLFLKLLDIFLLLLELSFKSLIFPFQLFGFDLLFEQLLLNLQVSFVFDLEEYCIHLFLQHYF